MFEGLLHYQLLVTTTLSTITSYYCQEHIDKVNEQIGKKGNSVLVWVANAVEGNDYYRERRQEVVNTMAMMIEHDAKTPLIDADISKWAVETPKASPVMAALNSLFNMREEARPGYHAARIERCVGFAISMLSEFDDIESGKMEVDSVTVAGLEPLCKVLMQLQPENTMFARKCIQARKIQSSIGAKTVKTDVKDKAVAIGDDPESEEKKNALTGVCALVTGVDMTDMAAEIQPSSTKALAHYKPFEDPAKEKHCIEVLARLSNCVVHQACASRSTLAGT